MKNYFLRRLAAVLAMAMILSCATATRPDDQSKASNVKHVRFLHLADMHAQLDTHWEYLPEDPNHLHKMGGFARIKTALEERRRSAMGAVFTVDGGDTFQGSAVAAWSNGKAILAPLNSLGIDVGTPGNWEVVYGPKAFRELMGEVHYRVICYNFIEKKTGIRLFESAAILEKEGVKVAFIGATDPTTTTRQPPAQVKGLDSTHIEGLRDFVRELKLKEKPDVTVLVDHTGLVPSIQLAHDIPEFDVVLSGHSHERVYHPIRVGNTLVVEPGSMGSFISQLDLTLQNGKVTSNDYELIYVDAGKYAEDAAVKALVERAEAPYRSRLDRIIGETKTSLMRYDVLEATMDNLVADAVRDETGTDIGFTNGFRFSPPIAPGPITEADLWSILPLDSRLKVGKITGQQLRAYLESEMELVFAKDPFVLSGGWGPRPSGMELTFTAKAEKGARIHSVRVHGREVTDEGIYSLGGCEREGEELDIICRLKGVKDTRYSTGTVHSALAHYIRKHSPLQLVKTHAVRADDLPAEVWSQYGTLQKMWNLPGDASSVAIPERKDTLKVPEAL